MTGLPSLSHSLKLRRALSWWLSSKESACSAEDAGDADSILGSGRSSGGGRGNPLQYSCLGNLMDTGAWRVTLHGGHRELDMAEVT